MANGSTARHLRNVDPCGGASLTHDPLPPHPVTALPVQLIDTSLPVRPTNDVTSGHVVSGRLLSDSIPTFSCLNLFSAYIQAYATGISSPFALFACKQSRLNRLRRFFQPLILTDDGKSAFRMHLFRHGAEGSLDNE